MFLKRSVLKDFFRFFLPLLLCFVSVYSLSRLSTVCSIKAADLISHIAGPNISLKRVFFSPIHGLRFEEVRVRDALGFDFSVGTVFLKYSVRELWSGRLMVKNIVMEDVKVHHWGDTRQFSLNDILGTDTKRLDKMWGGLDIIFTETAVCFKKVRLNLAQHIAQSPIQDITVDFCLDVYGGKLSCRGTAREVKAHGLSKPGYFAFHLDPVGKDLLVDMSLEYEVYRLDGSGMINDCSGRTALDIRFHSEPIPLSYYAWLKAVPTKEGQVSLWGHLTGVPNDLNLQAELMIPSTAIALEQDTLELDHVAVLLSYRLKDNVIDIEHIMANVDDHFAVSISGKIEEILSPILDLHCQIQPIGQDAKGYSWAVDFKGQSFADGFQGEVKFIWPGAESRQYLCFLKELMVHKRKSKMNQNGLSVSAQKIELVEQMMQANQEQILQKIFLDGLSLETTFLGKKIWVDQLILQGYGGRVSAKGDLYFNRKEREYNLNIRLDQLDLKNIKVFYPVYCEINGNVSGQVTASHHKGGQVKGVLTAEQFQLVHFNPLDKIAEFLGLNAIKEINNAQIVVDFDLSPQESIIEQFDFDSESLAMRSNFNVNQKRWLEGFVALSMPRAKLTESKIFKRLLSIAREREEKLDFLVRVSGYADSLRTELIESTLRDTLKERLSVRIQKYIEERINKAMESQGN